MFDRKLKLYKGEARPQAELRLRVVKGGARPKAKPGRLPRESII